MYSNSATSRVEQVFDDLQNILHVWTYFCNQIGVKRQNWLIYTIMVFIPIRYVSDVRACKWEEHLEQVQNTLLYMVADELYKRPSTVLTRHARTY